MENSFNEDVKKVNETNDVFFEAKYTFMRQLILISATLLGILASFHRVAISSYSARIFFLLSVVLLALGLLSLSIAAYGLVSMRNEAAIHLTKELHRKYKGVHRYIPEPKTHKVSDIFEIFEVVGHISLFLAVFCLAIYAILGA